MAKKTSARGERIRNAAKTVTKKQIIDAGSWAAGNHNTARTQPTTYEDRCQTELRCKVDAAINKVTALLPNAADGANPKQQYGDAKVALQLLPPALLVYGALGFKEGAIKYGGFNYRETKIEAMTYIGAILRHIEAYLDGEDIDPDSILGKPHLSGIIASAGILADATENGNLIDNRPKKGTATALLKKWERQLSK